MRAFISRSHVNLSAPPEDISETFFTIITHNAQFPLIFLLAAICPAILFSTQSHMNRIFIPSLGPADWRRLLSAPGVQWKPGKSALEMAVSWESARSSPRGIPHHLIQVLDRYSETQNAELLFAFPEHQVDFDGGGHPSQNDLWALMSIDSQLCSVAIEAKAGESFGPFIREWLQKVTERSTKLERLLDLQDILGLAGVDVNHLRYQLLHRAASAIKEAVRFKAHKALLLIQSFAGPQDEASFKAFKEFSNLMGANAAVNTIVSASCHRAD